MTWHVNAKIGMSCMTTSQWSWLQVNNLKKVAPLKGFSGYQGLLRAYVGAGLRKDLVRMEGSAVAQLIEKHRADSVPEAILNKATSSLKQTAKLR